MLTIMVVLLVINPHVTSQMCVPSLALMASIPQSVKLYLEADKRKVGCWTVA